MGCKIQWVQVVGTGVRYGNGYGVMGLGHRFGGDRVGSQGFVEGFGRGVWSWGLVAVWSRGLVYTPFLVQLLRESQLHTLSTFE